jgi:arginase
MKPLIIPAPFAISQYGSASANIHKRILESCSASQIMENYNPSNLLQQSCKILPPINLEKNPKIGNKTTPYLDAAITMQSNLATVIKENLDFNQKTLVFGGDHTISMGTGLGLSKITKLSKVGLIYVDAHGDCNTEESSQSKCLTGYPVAINFGLGLSELTKSFENNFLKKVAYIGIRDIDQGETDILKKIKAKVFSNIDVEILGISKILDSCLEYLKDCDYIWLSIDVDSLDSVYLLPGETDVPSSSGLTPRELLAVTKIVSQQKKHFLTEITQLNDLGKDTDISRLFSRISEIALGLGSFRYGDY